MRKIIIAAAICLALPVMAAEDFNPDVSAHRAPDPTVQALGQMAQQCQAREAQALVQGYTAQAHIRDLEERLAAAEKRAAESGSGAGK